MPLPSLARWNDDRLDDLKQQVDGMGQTVASVGAMKVEMRNVREALIANTQATQRVSGQLEDIQLEPIQRYRQFRQQVAIAILSAVLGGGLAVLGAVIVGGGGH